MSEETKQADLAAVPAKPPEVLPVAKEALTALTNIPPADELNRMWAFSVAVRGAKFLPPAVQQDTRSIFFLVAMANDMKLKWTHGLRSLYMTPDGKAGIQGDAALALLLSNDFKVEFPETTDEKATCAISRPNSGGSFRDTFTIQDAKTAGIYTARDGDVKKNWKSYPKVMLRWRAFMQTARVIAADVIGGLYLPEELQEIAEQDQLVSGYEGGEHQQFAVGIKKPEPEASVAGSGSGAPHPPGAATGPATELRSAETKSPEVETTLTAQTKSEPPVPGTDARLGPTAPTYGPTPPVPGFAIAEHWANLRGSLMGGLGVAEKPANQLMNAYFCGWFGVSKVKELPRDPAPYEQPFGILAEIVATKDLRQFQQHAREWGEQCRKAVDQQPPAELVAKFDQWEWAPQLRTAGWQVYQHFMKRGLYQQGPAEFIEWMEWIKLPTEQYSDALAFLLLSLKTSEQCNSSAAQIKILSSATGISMNILFGAVLKELKDGWEAATPAEVAAAVAVVERATPTPSKTATTAAAEEDDDSLELFGR